MLRQLFRAANLALAPLGLKLDRISRDFDFRLEAREDIQELSRRLASAFDGWAATQTVFPVLDVSGTANKIASLYDAFLASPYRSSSGGSRFNNLAMLHLIAGGLKPTLIVDSGTHEGASAWALSTGAPGARTLSFDIELNRLKRHEPGVEYVEKDWTHYDLGDADTSCALCYFDDHLDQVRRLLEAQRAGIPFAVFDDDFPLTAFVSMAHGGRALPKLEFVFDPALARRDTLTWRENGVLRSWSLDQGYLAQGRAAIAAADRLPNTSLITGIHQTPYRVVRLAKAQA